MLLASLGLHGLVLFTPVAPSEDDLVPPPDPEEDGIALTKIEAPQTRVAPSVASNPPVNSGTATAPSAAPSAAPTASGGIPNLANDNASQSPAPLDNAGSAGWPAPINPSVPPPPTTGITVSDNASGSTSGSSSGSVTSDEPLKEYLEIFRTYRGQTITQDTAKGSREAWVSSIADKGADYANLTPQPYEGDINEVQYSSGICLPETPLPVQMLVLAEPDGKAYTLGERNAKIFNPIQKIQTTGYIEFDQAAETLVKNHEYPDAGKPQAYLVEIKVDYSEAECQEPQDVADLPDEYASLLSNYSLDNPTTIGEAEEATKSWLQSLQDAGEVEVPEMSGNNFNSLAPEDFEVEVEYVHDLCLPVPPQKAWWGIVVEPDGTIRAEPESLRSTGYSIFDDRSKELVEEFDFPEADSTQVYVATVPVDYNDVNCKQPSAKTGSSTTTAASDDADAADTDTAAEEPQSTAIAFDPDRQEALIANGQEGLVSAPGSELATDIVNITIESWPEEIEQAAFLSGLDPDDGPVPVATAADAVFLSLPPDAAIDEIEDLYGVDASEEQPYEGAPLYELTEDDVPQLFVSLIGVGTGGSSTVAVIWAEDPRQESESAPDTTPESAEETTEPEDSEDSEDADPTASGEPEEETPAPPVEAEEDELPEPEPETPPATPEAPRGLGMLLQRRGAEALENL